MFGTVITVVSATKGSLTTAVLEQIIQKIKALGVSNLQIADLSKGQAVDIIVPETGLAFHQRVRDSILPMTGFDIFVQLNDKNRRKRVLFSDMDSTILQMEVIDELAAYFDLADKIKPITESAMRGEIGFMDSYIQRMALLKGKSISGLFHVLGNLKLSKGAKTLVKTITSHGGKAILLSGGFDFFTRPVADDVGFYKNFGNELVLDGDVITGDIVRPILDKDAKKRIVIEEMRDLGIPPHLGITVGDGANDIEMLKTPDVLGVSYFAKPVVEAITPHNIRYTSLVSLLYLQGYRDDEIVWVD